ncbi:MAG: hypothetical protein ACP5MW_05780 [Thermoplasmata archaeon]
MQYNLKAIHTNPIISSTFIMISPVIPIFNLSLLNVLSSFDTEIE